MSVLTFETATALSLLLQGAPAETVVTPNHDTPDWQSGWVDQLRNVEPSERMTIFGGLVSARPDAGAIYAEVFNPAKIKSGPEKPEKPEKQYRSDDYLKILSGFGYYFRLCDLDDRVEVNGRALDDVKEAEIRNRCRDFGLSRVNVIRDAFITEAARHRYHPIKDKLAALQWDGTDWIGTLTSPYYFNDAHNIFQMVMRRWLIGAVSKVFTATQNRMLVLDGEQGIGKSHFVSWLASPFKDYYTESAINPDDKDHLIRLMTTFIWEVGELGSTTRRADIEALKAFLTKQQVNVRMPYGHNDIIKPALASFIGTVNNIGGILNDASGSRRFMTVSLISINWEYARDIDVLGLWAQAVALFRAGETGNSPAEETALIRVVNAEYEIEDPLEDLLHKFFYVDMGRTDWFTPTLRIIEILHLNGWKGSTPRSDAMVIATACKKLGLRRTYTKRGTETLRGYIGLLEKTISPSNPPTFYQ